MTNRPELLTTAEIADLFRVHVGTVNKWVRDGRIKALSLPGGERSGYRFRRADVEALLAEPQSEATA